MKLPLKKNRLPRSFYDRSPVLVARQLLGKAMVRRIGEQWVGGLIVETEAYLAAADPASHSARGPTPSNASMFAAPGTLYVYPIHAKHCLNAVTEPVGCGSAVLIRALEPIWGLETMCRHRGYDDPRRLTRGPAMICQALAVDRQQDGADLVAGNSLTIADLSGRPAPATLTCRRIGLSRGADRPYRFLVSGSRFVSRPARRDSPSH